MIKKPAPDKVVCDACRKLEAWAIEPRAVPGFPELTRHVCVCKGCGHEVHSAYMTPKLQQMQAALSVTPDEWRVTRFEQYRDEFNRVQRYYEKRVPERALEVMTHEPPKPQT